MTIFLKVLAILIGIASMFGYGYFGIIPMWSKATLDLKTSDKYDMLSSICLSVFIVDMILIGIFS